MSTLKYPVAIIAVFVWIGFVCAISFLEARLKFRAPGITVKLGLGIGRLVFSALNKVEIVMALAIIINLLVVQNDFFISRNLLLVIPLLLLIAQTFWLLPALDARALSAINGEELPKTGLHFYYVGMEVVKVVCLFIFGLQLLNELTL